MFIPEIPSILCNTILSTVAVAVIPNHSRSSSEFISVRQRKLDSVTGWCTGTEMITAE